MNSQLPTPSAMAAMRGRWVEALVQINRRLVDLRQQRHRYFELVDLGIRTPELRRFPMFSQWFAVFAAMAIRREMDRDSDVVSLIRILDEIARQPGEVLDFQDQVVDKVVLRAHRRELGEMARKTVAMANKEIAHAVPGGLPPGERPSLREIFACVDKLESISIHYTAMLTGETLMTTDAGLALQVRIAGADRRPGAS